MLTHISAVSVCTTHVPSCFRIDLRKWAGNAGLTGLVLPISSEAGSSAGSPRVLGVLDVLLSLDVERLCRSYCCRRRGVLDLALALDLDLSLGAREPVPEFLSTMHVVAAPIVQNRRINGCIAIRGVAGNLEYLRMLECM